LNKQKKILICPLDWGIGHTTRCIPVINKLREFNFKVIIACNNFQRTVFEKEINNCEYVYFKGYNITYSKTINVWLKLLLLIPKIFFKIIIEHQKIKKLVKKHDIDIIISDNRFGLWNKKIKSIYLTHQLLIKCPKYLKFAEPFLAYFHKILINKYDECWIPDFNGEINLSGDLSHKYTLPNNAHFIGPLSRFENINTSPFNSAKFDYLFLISGPEPQRTILENKVLDIINYSDKKFCIVRGNPNLKNITIETSKNNQIINYADTNTLYSLIKNSDIIVSRSGYSTVMDLAFFSNKIIFVPTPGQTEQEYLAGYLSKNHFSVSITQSSFANILKTNINYNKYQIEFLKQNSLLRERILNF